MKTLLRKVESPIGLNAVERFPGYIQSGSKDGWFYPVHETQTVFVAASFGNLVKLVAAHLKGNRLEVPVNLTAVIETWWCENVDGASCEESDGRREKAMKADGAARRFLNFAKDWIAQGGGLVAQEEANRRAEICKNCPLNQHLENCTGCFWRNLLKGAFAMFSRRSTPHDAKLKQCGACSCELKLKVWFPKESMQDDTVEWHESCWMRDP